MVGERVHAFHSTRFVWKQRPTPLHEDRPSGPLSQKPFQGPRYGIANTPSKTWIMLHAATSRICPCIHACVVHSDPRTSFWLETEADLGGFRLDSTLDVLRHKLDPFFLGCNKFEHGGAHVADGLALLLDPASTRKHRVVLLFFWVACPVMDTAAHSCAVDRTTFEQSKDCVEHPQKGVRSAQVS